jgi:hypothetical protein
LAALITRLGLQGAYPQAAVWEIKADVAAFITGATNRLALVECKLGPITLKDVGQMLGYSRVAKPVLSLLVSPHSATDALRKLLTVYGRYDILEYDENRRRILIGRWDPVRSDLVHSETLPPGEQF